MVKEMGFHGNMEPVISTIVKTKEVSFGRGEIR